jgi:hypothetical protein
MSFEQPISKEKESAWENKIKEVENSSDYLGHEIDERIKEIIAAFNLVELPTSASCEGHIDHGISAPWVEISAPDQPEERYVGEKEIFKKIAEKRGVSLNDAKRGINKEAWAEALKESSLADETQEYKQWREKNKELADKVSEALKLFYENRNVSDDSKLQILQGGEGEFRIWNGGEDYRPVPKNLTDEQKSELAQRINKYQKEFKDFAGFLKNKYFLGESI